MGLRRVANECNRLHSISYKLSMRRLSNKNKQGAGIMEKTIIKDRIERLKGEMRKRQIDTIMIFSDENRKYLSGYTGEDSSYDETAGILIITEKHNILVTDPRYDVQAKNEAGDFYFINCYTGELARELTNILKATNSKKVGVEAARLSYGEYRKLADNISKNNYDIEFNDAMEILNSLRIKKDDDEINEIKAALNIAETAFMELRNKIKPGMTEKASAWLLEKLMREKGADSLSFPVIAAAGKNSALPHAIPGNKKFKKGEPLLFDFGAKLNGYCSDTTRTLVMGKPDDTFKTIYEILFNAQQLAVDNIKPGIIAHNIDKTARDYIDATQFKGKFTHSLGHGVGLAIHEAPRLSKKDNTILEPGMIITVEPGIYLPEWGGIRLENMVMVTDNGSCVLNTMDYNDYIIDV